MTRFRKSVRYCLDNGEEIAIEVLYFTNLGVEPEERLEAGGFVPDDDYVECGVITTRNKLKPRSVQVELDSGKRVNVFVKTRERLDEIIEDPDLDIGIAKRYSGEEYLICLPSNNNN